MAAVAAAICVALPAGSAQAATATDAVNPAAAAPKWCGHDTNWVKIGDWLYRFISHNNEGGRHIHNYNYQHAFNSAIRGEDTARC